MKEIPEFSAEIVELTNDVITGQSTHQHRRTVRRTTGTPKAVPKAQNQFPAKVHKWASAIVQDQILEYNQALSMQYEALSTPVGHDSPGTPGKGASFMGSSYVDMGSSCVLKPSTPWRSVDNEIDGDLRPTTGSQTPSSDEDSLIARSAGVAGDHSISRELVSAGRRSRLYGGTSLPWLTPQRVRNLVLPSILLVIVSKWEMQLARYDIASLGLRGRPRNGPRRSGPAGRPRCHRQSKPQIRHRDSVPRVWGGDKLHRV
jgi:hypothetical protein